MNFHKRKEEWVPATEEAILAESRRSKKPAADEDAATPGGKTKHQKAIEDSASFVQNLASQQLGGNVQEKQLTELQMIRAADQKNADMMEKMLQRYGMAVFG